MIYWPAKRPGAVLDYAFDWAGSLAEGEAIAAGNVTGTGVTIDAVTFDATSVSVKLSGGTLGAPAVLVCSITTNATPARSDEETAILPIGEEPVSLAMAQRQLRDPPAEDDELILELVQAAREHVEAYCGVTVVPAALAMTFPSFDALERLGRAPVQSITEVRYLDSSGVSQLLDPGVYELVAVDADPLRPIVRRAFGQSWPAIRAAEDAVTVSAVAGYVAVPRPIIRAILLLVTHWYDNRQLMAAGQTMSEIPHAVTALLSNFRR